MKASFVQKYGPWGVVTGGTQGIGKALVESIAARGLNVVIIGTKEVEKVAAETANRFQVQTKAIKADLGDPRQIDRIMEECHSLTVGLSVYTD
jgi:short-subunit dehydrogenase